MTAYWFSLLSENKFTAILMPLGFIFIAKRLAIVGHTIAIRLSLICHWIVPLNSSALWLSSDYHLSTFDWNSVVNWLLFGIYWNTIIFPLSSHLTQFHCYSNRYLGCKSIAIWFSFDCLSNFLVPRHSFLVAQRLAIVSHLMAICLPLIRHCNLTCM